MNFRALAKEATYRALQMRQRYGLSLSRAVSPFDFALEMGLSVHLTAVPSLEGIYQADAKPAVLISSLRPAGRRAYTCAHEIGHYVFGHGTRIDEILDAGEDHGFEPEEYVADRFASALLMPKLAVEAAFARRGWRAASATPEQIFIVAQALGVGYTTLVGYLHRTLNVLPAKAASSLERQPLKTVRRSIMGFEPSYDLFLVDETWGERPVDVEVGDTLLVPLGVEVEGSGISRVALPRLHLVAVAPGQSRIADPKGEWFAQVRVSRRNYEGSARYRHLEDPDFAG